MKFVVELKDAASLAAYSRVERLERIPWKVVRFRRRRDDTRCVVDVLLAEGHSPFEFRNWKIQPHRLALSYEYQNLLLYRKSATDLS